MRLVVRRPGLSDYMVSISFIRWEDKVRTPPLGPLAELVSSSVMGPMEWVYLPKRCGMKNID
jgi:hypothetical protein